MIEGSEQLDGVRIAEEVAEAIPDDAAHWKREHFIPLRKADLIHQLTSKDSLGDDQHQLYVHLCSIISASLHFLYHQKFDELARAYAVVDPDSDTKAVHAITDEQREDRIELLFSKFAELMTRANFEKLARVDLEQAIGAASHWGVRLHVTFDIFDRLEVYGRGDIIGRRLRRHWRNLYRPEEVEVPIYQRLVVIFRLRGDKGLEDANPHHVHIKMFKNIPKQDVDMMLPGSRVCMSWLDQGRILLPTLSGVAIAIFKIIKGALVLAFAGIYGFLAFLVFVGGTVGYGLKSFLGYLHTKDKYHLNLTRSLYYQNLDNNAGVLHRLMDEAEQQDFRETMLAYSLLWQHAGRVGWTPERLDVSAEARLKSLLDVDVDFEVHDALEKLKRFGMAERLPSGRWRAVAIEKALANVDQKWDAAFRWPASA